MTRPRPWLEHYDYWVRPHMTYPGRPLGEILAIAAVQRPDTPATHFLGAELTFLELKRRADALAAALADLGIAKGDRVGIMLPNCPQYIVAAFAILRLGAEKRRRRAIGTLDRGGGEDVSERSTGVGGVRPHPVVVVLQPRPRGVRGWAAHAMVRPPSTTIV